MSRLAWLLDRFQAHAASSFMSWRGEKTSYAWLLERVSAWRARLDAHGVASGTVVAFYGDYAPEPVALLLALIERGAVCVPLTPSVLAHVPEFLEIAEAEVLIDFATGGEIVPRPKKAVNPLTQVLRERNEPGLVLFTSGSTGKAKAALHDFARLLEKFQQPRHCLVTLPFLMFDHIGGINTLLYVLSNGGKLVIPESRDPERVCEEIARHRVELLPTSPTFLNLLLISEAYRRHDLSSLVRVTYGTEPMPQRTLERIHEILPAVELQQTYGLTEIGILRSKSRGSGSLEVKVGGEGFETKVVDGTLRIRARSAMLGYLNAPSPFDAEGWLDTQDAVVVDGEYLRILGRRSEIVNVGGQKVHPAEVESVLLQMPNVKDVAVSGEKNPITGQIVTARFNLVAPEELSALRTRMRAFCRDKLPTYKIPARIEIVTEEQYSARFKKMRPRNG